MTCVPGCTLFNTSLAAEASHVIACLLKRIVFSLKTISYNTSVLPMVFTTHNRHQGILEDLK